MKNRFFLWLFIVAISISLVGCGSSKNAETATQDRSVSVTFSESAGNNENQEAKSNSSASAANPSSAEKPSIEGKATINNVNVSQKVIFTGQVDFETLDFNKTTTQLCDYIRQIGGYSQSTSVQGGKIGYTGLRSAEYIFRIPKSKYSQAFIDMKQFGTVVLEQSRGEDVTEQYFDTEARLKSLRIQQERLQTLLQKATKMEDILTIEKELQTTLYEIEKYTGTIKKWDSLIEYSTLTVNVREVAEIKPEIKKNDGFLYRLSYGFINSVKTVWEFLQDFVIFIVSALPIIIPLGLIGYFAYRAIRKRAKNKVKGNDE